MVPVVRTKVVPVEVEFSVSASDYVTFTVGPRTNVEISKPIVIPDNFVKLPNGEFAEGISLAGEISRVVQYLEGEAPPASNDSLFAQIQVTSKDKKRKSAVINEELAGARAQKERRVEGNRITEISRFMLAGMFIPYTQIRDVLYDTRGSLGKQLVLTITIVDGAGNILIGPGGAVTITQAITIGSFFLPPRLQPGIPWIIWSPVVLIPRCPIPFPGSFTTPRRPPRGTTPGGRIGGGTTAGGGIGTGAQPGRRMGAGTGTGTGTAGTGAGTGTGTGTGTAGGTGSTQIGGAGIAGASGVYSPTLTVTVPSKKQLVYWFNLPEKDGNRHEVSLDLVNYSIGLGLANLSVIAKDQEKEFKRSRALIETLPNVSVALEMGKIEELKTLDLSDKVATISPENRTYILVLVAPTIDENLIEIKVDPAWAKEMLFQQPAEMSLPTKIDLAKSK
jgi:hypothetical protein